MQVNIKLEQTAGLHFCGSKLNGLVRLSAECVTDVQNVTVTLLGRERTENVVERTEKSTNGSIIELVNEVTELLGEVQIPVGDSLFYFKFTIPDGIPPSFESSLGFIRYMLLVRVRRPHPFFDIVETHPICVSPIYNLKSVPYTLYKAQRSVTHKLTWFGQGHVDLKVALKKSGFVCGEKLEIRANVDNWSSRDVLAVRLVLLQTTRFYQFSKAGRALLGKAEQVIFALEQPFQVRPHHCNVFRARTPPLPPCSPSFEHTLIYVDYHLKTQVVVHMEENVTIDVPLLIGSIPVKGTANSVTKAFHQIDRLPPPAAMPIEAPLESTALFLEPRSFRKCNIRDGVFCFSQQGLLPLYVYYNEYGS